MRADEVVGWGDLAGEVVARGAGHVEQVHRAAADRVFGLVHRGTAGAALPARALHDAVTGLVHTSVRHGGRFAARAGARVAGWAWPRDARPGVQGPVAAAAQATVVGLFGDQLAEAGSPVAYPVRLRADGRDVVVSPRSLAEAYPDATGRIAVFVAGLFETEDAWRYRAARWWGDPTSTIGTRLAADGWTPVLVRYPSSQPLEENGHELAGLLRRMVATWPVAVDEIALVGHSMGGLVARHAVHAAYVDDQDWVTRCRHLVCLGTPHGGSPVARGAAAAARTLDRLPETRPIADIIELRSPGIRDLEVTDPVPDVEHVDVHAVVVLLTRHRSRLAAEVLGDLLVGASSAGGLAGDGSRVRLASARTFTGLHHFDLLNHPDVDAHVREVLRS